MTLQYLHSIWLSGDDVDGCDVTLCVVVVVGVVVCVVVENTWADVVTVRGTCPSCTCSVLPVVCSMTVLLPGMLTPHWYHLT